MIRSFRDKRTAQIYAGKAPRGVPQDVLRRAMVKLFLLDTATRLQDLGVPPGNELEALKGDRSGQYSIRVNRQWRLCFRWSDESAHDVEFVDYH